MTSGKDNDNDEQDLLRAVAQEAQALLAKAGGPVTRISVQSGKARVEIEWDPSVAPSAGAPLPVGLAAADDVFGAGDATGKHVITAPLVGTFYSAPEPGAKPFVEVGDPVEPEQEIGIIEAMKIMNRIVADTAGTVAEILVEDGQMVEFGQPLMYVEPAEAGG